MKLYELHGHRHLTHVPIRAMQAHPVTKPTPTKAIKHPVKAIKPPKPRHKPQRIHF